MSGPKLSDDLLAQQREFLHSIQETPEDDAPRLIYADWLEDHGDPARGGFIRTQCRLAALPGAAPERPALKAREADLLKRNKAGWLGPWDSPRNEVVFRRGFLTSLRIGSNFGIALGSLKPAVSPHLDLLESLSFQGGKLAEGVLPLLGESTPCLRRVECVNCIHGNAIVQALAGWPAETPLTELYLPTSEVGAAGLRTLTSAPWVPHLRALDLRNNHFDELALIDFLRNAPLAGLGSLRLSGGRFFSQRDVAPELAKHLPALRRLRIAEGQLGDRGLESLIEAGLLARLTELEVAANYVTQFGVRALAESHEAAGLTTLSLRRNHLGDDAVRALAWSPYLRNLACLDLGQTDCGPDGIRAVAESPHLANLVTLRLDLIIGLPGDALDPLLVPGRLPKLRHLTASMSFADDPRVERFKARGVELSSTYSD